MGERVIQRERESYVCREKDSEREHRERVIHGELYIGSKINRAMSENSYSGRAIESREVYREREREKKRDKDKLRFREIQ